MLILIVNSYVQLDGTGGGKPLLLPPFSFLSPSSFLLCLDSPSRPFIGLSCFVHCPPTESDGVSKSICFRIKSGFLCQFHPSKLLFIVLAGHPLFPIACLYASFYQPRVGMSLMLLLGVGDKNLL